MGLINKIVRTAVVLLEDAIERLGDPHGSQVMEDALRHARDRGAELAIENARLQGEVETLISEFDTLQDRRLTLYSDEVTALCAAMKVTAVQDTAVIEHLLHRTRHEARTFEQAHRYLHAVVMGHTRKDGTDE